MPQPTDRHDTVGADAKQVADEFAREADSAPPGIVREFGDFLLNNNLISSGGVETIQHQDQLLELQQVLTVLYQTIKTTPIQQTAFRIYTRIGSPILTIPLLSIISKCLAGWEKNILRLPIIFL